MFARSEEDVGSLFSLHIPLPIGEAADIEDDSTVTFEQSPSYSQLRVLVAEDQEINQMVIEEVLSHYDCDVTLVANGKEAVDAISEIEFDVVLMDIQMPIMNGYEATQKIRAFNSEIPIYALSASVMESDRKASIDAGMNGHLSKPINAVEIEEALASAQSFHSKGLSDSAAMAEGMVKESL